MSYTQDYKNAKSKGEVTKENVELFTLCEEEPQLIGKLLSKHKRESDKNKGEYYTYVFDTDKGPVSIAPGTVADKVFTAKKAIGKLYSITFIGKKKGANGREFNDYIIERFKIAKE